MADEVGAAASVGVGYCDVYDLDEGLRHFSDLEGSRSARMPTFSESRYGAPGRSEENYRKRMKTESAHINYRERG